VSVDTIVFLSRAKALVMIGQFQIEKIGVVGKKE
jgi:hypothetical protein